MILVCRDCHKKVPFGEDCPCGGVVELAKTQMDELLYKAWQYQKLAREYREEFGLDYEAIQVPVAPLGRPAGNADDESEPVGTGVQRAGSQRSTI
jgi:hypothetical protein